MTSEADRLRNRLFHDVLDHGYVVQHIPTSVAAYLQRGTSYAYTVGRTLAGEAELLVAGLDGETSKALIDEIVRREWATHNGHRVRLVACDTNVLTGALALFGSIRAFQLLWADADGRYPDEDGDWVGQTVHRTTTTQEDA